MNCRAMFVATIAAICFSATGSQAQTAYSAEDVIKHFAKQANLGANRGICVGTRSECDQQASADAAPADPFNLTVTFEFGSTQLTGEAQQNLSQFAKALQDDRLDRAKFRLEGHTDAVGSEEANQRLSEARARAVATYLVGQGVSVLKVTPVGFGEERLAVEADPAHPDNRRVEARMVLE
ncbi:MAG: OmpA family protein [Pseudomonadota bacterium]